MPMAAFTRCAVSGNPLTLTPAASGACRERGCAGSRHVLGYSRLDLSGRSTAVEQDETWLGVQIPIEAPLPEQCLFRARRGGSYR